MPMPQIASDSLPRPITVIPLATRIPARGKGRRTSQIVAMQDVLYSTVTNPRAAPRDRAQAAQAKVRAKTRSTLARTLSITHVPDPPK